MDTDPTSRPELAQRLILSPLITRVRRRGILRTSRVLIPFQFLEVIEIFGDYLWVEYLCHAFIMPSTKRNGMSSTKFSEHGGMQRPEPETSEGLRPTVE